MGSKDDIAAVDKKRGLTPEQLGLLIVMIGVVLMTVGIYTTEELFSFIFNIGLGLLVLGSLLFALFIWARGYQLQHMPIPLPEVVREMLRTGNVRSDQSILEKSGFAPGPDHAVTRTFATQPLQMPQTQPLSTRHEPSPAPGFVSPEPRPVQPITPAPAPVQVALQPQPVPAPPITPPPTPVTPVPSPESGKPEPKKEQYMDVLEEADKEFESYIDKLIEE